MSEVSETEIKKLTKAQNYFRGYFDGKSDVLEQIRAEIEDINPWAIRYAPLEDGDTRPKIVANVKNHVIEIIDKYRVGSEE